MDIFVNRFEKKKINEKWGVNLKKQGFIALYPAQTFKLSL